MDNMYGIRMFASVANDGVTSLAVDESNNVYAVGYYEAELPVYESIKLQRNGNNRTAFVAKYSDEGEVFDMLSLYKSYYYRCRGTDRFGHFDR